MKFPKGFRFALWPRFKFWRKPKGIAFEFKFTESCIYNHNGPDQYDWNKLTGVTFGLNAQKNTVMIGWRWNLDTEMFELCAYYHDRKDRHFSDPLLEIAVNQKGRGEIFIDWEDREYMVLIGSTVDTRHFTHKRKLARLVNPWFGGTKKPPHKMIFSLKFIR